MSEGTEQADSGWDNYAERVLRNEGRLLGLESLVAETREADRKLIEQRSESLAQELERRAEALLELVTARADAVLSLSQTERQSDQREFREALANTVKAREDLRNADAEKNTMALGLLREVYDTALRELAARMDVALDANLAQSTSVVEALAAQVQAWRESDTEARKLQADEYSRRLDELNHNHMRTQEILRNSVTRDLWQATEEAWNQREKTDHDKINALERNMLLLTPISSSDKAHEQIHARIDDASARIEAQINARIDGLGEKVADLRSSRDTTTGRTSGYTALYGWLVAGIGLLITIIILANTLLGG